MVVCGKDLMDTAALAQVGAIMLQLSQVFLKIWCDLLTTVVRWSYGCCTGFLTDVARSPPPAKSKCIIDGQAEPDFSQGASQARVKQAHQRRRECPANFAMFNAAMRDLLKKIQKAGSFAVKDLTDTTTLAQMRMTCS